MTILLREVLVLDTVIVEVTVADTAEVEMVTALMIIPREEKEEE